jgi:hypothetical protein
VLRSLRKALVLLAGLALLQAGCGGPDSAGPARTAPADDSGADLRAAPVSTEGVHPLPWRDPEAAAPINTAGAHLTYYGGRVVSNVRVVQVIYGSGSYLPQVTSTASPSMATFYGGVASSPYFDWLTEYNTNITAQNGQPGTNQAIGRGSFVGQFTITPSAANDGSTISTAQIQSELEAQIEAGHLPAPTTDAAGNDNSYYAIFFPHGKVLTLGSSSSCVPGGFCAYHGTLSRPNGQHIYFGVHPDMQAGSGCETGCGGGGAAFAYYCTVASHELVETVTDGEVGLATVVGPPLAWYDSVNGEIGDICNGQQGSITGGDGVGYTVQKEWSNTAGACITTRTVTPVDAAQFVSQANVPTQLTTNATATVTVTMKNTGTTTWDSNYRLGSQDPQDNTTWGLNRVLLNPGETVAPGASRSFTFTIKAPAAAGTGNFQWRMVHEAVTWFGDFSPAVAITVSAPVADSAQFLSQAGVPTQLIAGQLATVSVTMKNTGSATWDSNYRLGSQDPQDNNTWGLGRVFLNPGETVAPGASKTFTFTITAPRAAGSAGFQWRMVHEAVTWFGDFTPLVNIAVSAAPAYAAQFLSQSGVPARMSPGSAATVSITMRNLGTNSWTAAANYRLGSQDPQDNTTWGLGRVDLAASDSIGQDVNKTFTFTIRAPATAGTYGFQWRMVQEAVTWFGDFSPAVNIVVQ